MARGYARGELARIRRTPRTSCTDLPMRPCPPPGRTLACEPTAPTRTGSAAPRRSSRSSAGAPSCAARADKRSRPRSGRRSTTSTAATRSGPRSEPGRRDRRRGDRDRRGSAPRALPLLERALVYVTGKGGAGKTTVAAALGLAAAARGRRTVVCDLAGSHQLARAYGADDADEAQLADRLVGALDRPSGRARGVAAPPARRRRRGRGAHPLAGVRRTSWPPPRARRSS